MTSDLYTILGIDKDASQDDIKKAYHKCMVDYHPDKNGGEVSEQYQQCRDAYDILSDVLMRRQYDQTGEIPEKQTGNMVAKEFAALVHAAISKVGIDCDLIQITRDALISSIKDVESNMVDARLAIKMLERAKAKIICKTDDKYLLLTFDSKITALINQIGAFEQEIKEIELVVEYANNYEYRMDHFMIDMGLESLLRIRI